MTKISACNVRISIFFLSGETTTFCPIFSSAYELAKSCGLWTDLKDGNISFFQPYTVPLHGLPVEKV